MKSNRTHLLLKMLIPLMTLSLVILACAPKTSRTDSPGDQNSLAILQQNQYLKASLFAVMTFDSGVQTLAFPSKFNVSSVPIIWMGTLFNGRLKEVGPGEDVTEEVHGSVSPDGAWVETLFFSRMVIRATNNSGTFYRVTLRNVPISMLVNGISELGTFKKEGADLQKYVDKIEYSDGQMNGNQIVATSTYVSTEWQNTADGQKPVLKLTFEIAASEILPGFSDKPVMGMGEK